MKVVHLALNYAPALGGLQSLLQEVSERLVTSHGDEVEVWTTNALTNPAHRGQRYIPPGEVRVNGVLVRRYRFAAGGARGLRVASSLARTRGVSLSPWVAPLAQGPLSVKMATDLLRSDADVVAAAPIGYWHTALPLLTRRLGRRVSLVVIGALHVTGDELPRDIVRIATAADRYIALTPFERDVLVRHGVPRERVVVIGPGVDVERLAGGDRPAMRRRLGLGSGPVIGYLGRQAEYKGIDTLIAAMTTVWPMFPDASLLIAGAPTPYSAAIKEHVARLPLAQRDRVVIVDGFAAEDAASLYAAIDIVASVSTEESYGLVFLEAWAARRPVVGGDIGAVRSVMGEEDGGVLVPCGDPASLAVALVRLLGDPAQREHLAGVGHERVRRDHGWDTVVAQWRDVYADAAREGRHPPR